MSEPKQLFSANLAKDAVYKTGLRSFMESVSYTHLTLPTIYSV